MSTVKTKCHVFPSLLPPPAHSTLSCETRPCKTRPCETRPCDTRQCSTRPCDTRPNDARPTTQGRSRELAPGQTVVVLRQQLDLQQEHEFVDLNHLLPQEDLVSNWMLTSCQPPRVTSRGASTTIHQYTLKTPLISESIPKSGQIQMQHEQSHYAPERLHG